MRILAMADIHGAESVVYMAQEISGLYNYDVIMIAGDITNFGPANTAEIILNNLPGKVFAVPGNCDPPDVINAIERSKAVNLHWKKRLWAGYTLAGVGGVNGGFSMGIIFNDKDAERFLGACKNCIFLTHQPPYGILDAVGGRHAGSRGIINAIQKAQPILVISGHIHESRGHFYDGNTLFVNPGPAREGYASIVDTESRQVTEIEI
ncbi:MAG: phosphodiesterase [Euryarchaeota archaeon]|nr:phosphodiesterase [Euryarchaeota archaeon]